MNERLAKAEAIFHDAWELPLEQREEFLQKACGEDAELYREIVALLRASGIADHWLREADCPALAASIAPAVPDRITEGPGTLIGRYKLLQKIGEGGCGMVYMAQQEQPVRRKVALKVIKLGMDTKQVIARFEAERQALAMMDHPNIAKVLDAGATDTGRPYFVMELVRGIRITDYCDQNNLSTTERLSLFTQICQAVQHAHQKGIIHRDIKPSNILVTLHDAVPVPKVIDFGIAKATGEQRLTDNTLFTAFEQFIGTPAYMSPEQAEMSGLDIDTRTDIYALGVLLYELLTGKTPFDAKQWMAAGLDEIRRTIREQEPARPSTRLSTMLEGELTATARHRRTEPPKLIHLVRGDLDWMVMKCLEKDRTRRYETASALALDIQRHLNNELVLARPPSNIYRLKKLVRRNKLAFGAGTAVAAALMSGLALSTWLFLRERATRNVADENARLADQKARESRRNLYAADMILAQSALEAGNIGRARDLLRKYLPRKEETDLRGWEWRYAWEQCRTDELFTLKGHALRVTSLALSTNGVILASGSDDENVMIWDLQKKTPIRTLRQTGGVLDLVFSRDEKELIVGTADGQATFWNCETWERLTTLTNLSRVRSLTVSPDGELLAVFGLRILTLWNLADRQQLATLPLRGGNEFIHGGVAFSPDSSLLAYCRGDGAIVLRDLPMAKTVAELQGHDRYVSGIAFSPDGSSLVSCSRDRTVRVWDITSRKQIRQIGGFSGFVIALAFSPDGGLLAVVAADQRVRLFETRFWEEINTLKGHSDAVYAVVFSPDGRTIVTGSKDATVKCWVTSTNRQPVVYRLPSDVYSSALLPGATGLYLAHTNHTYSFWRTDPLQEIERYPFPFPLTDFLWSTVAPNGNLWVAATTNGIIKVFDHRKQTFISDLRLPAAASAPTTAPLRGRLAFSADSQTLAALGSDYTCRLWRVASFGAPQSDEGAFQQIAEFETAKRPVWSRVIFSNSGQLLALGYDGGLTDIWNIAFRRKLASLVGDNGDQVMDIAISRDESTAVTACGSGKATVWDLRSALAVATFKAELGTLQSVAFSPDDTRIAACGGEGTVRIWDLASRQEVATLKLHNERLSQLAFRDDESLVVLAADAFGNSRLFILRAPREPHLQQTLLQTSEK